MNSSIPECRSNSFFASSTSVTVSGVTPYRVTMACEVARSASSSVRPRKLFGHGVEACRIQGAFQGAGLPYSDAHFVDDLAQTLLVRQGQFEELDQAAQLRRNRDRRRSDDDGATVGGELLPHVAQPPDHDRVVHVAMKVFENECRFERHRLQVAERLGWFLAVVERLGAGIVWIVPRGARPCPLTKLGSVPGPILQRHCHSEPARWRCSTRKWPDSARSRRPAPGEPRASLPRFPSRRWAWRS